MSLGSNEFESRFGQLLYRLLPAVYRERDNTEYGAGGEIGKLGDLAGYLDAIGLVLDQLRATLDQRLADAFPDNSEDGGRTCQEWLLPYFARLLDVRLVSPDSAGRRDEVAHAIRWRQGKGTLPCVEEIGEAITRLEAELQEGWRRVALTPRVGLPLLPAAVYGVMRPLDPRQPAQVTRHPGLPACTVDLRCTSRMVQTESVTPAAKQSRLAGAVYRWMQANPHGVPAAPGGVDDVSRRTVDLRTPAWNRGHVHPRRLIAYTPVPWGLFPPPAVVVECGHPEQWQRIAWVHDPAAREIHLRNLTDHPLVLPGDLRLPPIDADPNTRVIIEGLQFTGKIVLTRGTLELRNVIANKVEVHTEFFDKYAPVFTASDSLIGTVTVPGGYSSFKRCTVRRKASCGALLARDTLFAADLDNGAGKSPTGRVDYCRVPPGLATLETATPPGDPEPSDDRVVIDASCTNAMPLFFASDADDPAHPVGRDAAVLSPDAPHVLFSGASEGGEIGCYNAGRTHPIVLRLPQTVTLTAPVEPPVLRDLVFAAKLTVSAGARRPLQLERVAVSELLSEAGAGGAAALQLNARSSLFGTLTVNLGRTQLEYCTVLGATLCAGLQASDCVFAGTMDFSGTGDCVRYSRLPPATLGLADPAGLRFPHCTAEAPVFFEANFARAANGHAGGGVLHPAVPLAISGGAEDGGEMGAHHDQRHCLSRAAVISKLADHLPLGLEPVLVPDYRLHDVPAVERVHQEP